MIQLRHACVVLAFILPVGAAVAQPSGYDLVFADEFNGSTLDTMKWQSRYPWGRNHNHKAYMSDDALSFNGESLVITATDTPNGNKDFTSGAISTGYNKFRFSQGYVEARIDQPSQPGSWTAFWMLDNGWPPEIDIMEFPIRNNGDTYAYKTNYHWRSGGNNNSIGTPDHFPGGNLASGYHRYGLRWTNNKLEFYFDGRKIREFNNNGAVSDMTGAYLILNYAVANNSSWGGELPNTVNPSTWSNTGNKMRIDWVRVYQREDDMDTRFLDPQGDGAAEWAWDTGWDSGSAPSMATQTVRLGTQASSTQSLDWDRLNAVGRVYFDGDTGFTLGDGNESMLMAMGNGSGWSRIWVEEGNAGTHSINSRLELWSNLSIANQRNGRLRIDGDIISLAREGYGGRLVFRGGGNGDILLNGTVYQQRSTELSSAALVFAKGGFYQEDALFSDAVLTIRDGSTLVLEGGLNVMGQTTEGQTDQSLGYLPVDSDRLILDDGTIRLRGSTASYRGFTIGQGGATLVAENGSDVWLRQSSLASKAVVSDDGGDLTLSGDADGFFDKILPGTGGLILDGSGAWTLGQANTYAGETLILNGHLIVNGSTGSGQTTLADGARLSGSGLIAGDLLSSGLIAPGNSPGVLDIAGSLSLQAREPPADRTQQQRRHRRDRLRPTQRPRHRRTCRTGADPAHRRLYARSRRHLRHPRRRHHRRRVRTRPGRLDPPRAQLPVSL